MIKQIAKFRYSQLQKLNLKVFQPELKDTTEIFDSDEQINQKVQLLHNYIKNSKYGIMITGAGISTSSGIPDFRSGGNTILKTGPGKWEKQENKQKYYQKHGVPQITPAIKAIPSFTHMAISELINQGFFKKIITQNVDGLHRKSRVQKQKIIELHGNINVEICQKCNKHYYRDYYCRNKEKGWSSDHFNGNYCSEFKCGGELHDTLVYFGESVKQFNSQTALLECNKADFCLVVGTSLTVNSASKYPFQLLKKNIPVAIINLQQTLIDQQVNLKINGYCDHIMAKLMQTFNLKVPQFQVERNVFIQFIKQGLNSFLLEIKGEDWELDDFSIIERIEIHYRSSQNDNNIKVIYQYREPFLFQIQEVEAITKIIIKFYSNYGEPKLILQESDLNNGKLMSSSSSGSVVLLRSNLKLNATNGQWMVNHITEEFK